MKVSCGSRKQLVFLRVRIYEKYAMHQGMTYLKTINCLNLFHVQTTSGVFRQ